jgi:N terminal extension of bacteriophage endosialidase.
MRRVFLAFVFCFFGAALAQVEFPIGSTVVNVTKPPYKAKGDGKTDDTQAIQQALDDHPNGDYIIYLPHRNLQDNGRLVWRRRTSPPTPTTAPSSRGRAWAAPSCSWTTAAKALTTPTPRAP